MQQNSAQQQIKKHMRIGIIGKPNIGKSSFFKAATMADIEIQNYPFTTIKPNVGVAHVRAECPAENFFKVKCNPRHGFCIDGQRFVQFELVDVAGLVPGAAEGKGLGNQFLDDLANVDALIHVIDVSGSTNTQGELTGVGKNDPAEDVKFIEKELDDWYFGIFMRGKTKIERQIRLMTTDTPIEKFIAEHFSGLNVKENHVINALKASNLKGKPITQWSEEDYKNFTRTLRLMSKPMVFAANKIDIEGAEGNFNRLVAAFPQYKFISTCALAEIQIRLAEKQRVIKYTPGNNDFQILELNKLTEQQKRGIEKIKIIMQKFNGTGVQQTINFAVLGLLKYKVIFPGGVNKLEDSKGNVMPDAFLMPQEATALDFAYKLHTDFGDNFIGAIDVKRKQKIGRDAVLKDGDVIEILSNK